MNRETWKPKVGDKVKVTGVLQMCDGNASAKIMEGAVWECKSPSEGMVRLWRLTERGPQDAWVHIRNLDPVLEDERRGAPRPPEQKGELVHITIAARWEPGSNSFFLGEGHEDVWIDRGDGLHYRKPLVVKVRQIERRNPGCKACMDRGCNEPGCTARGREARKS